MPKLLENNKTEPVFAALWLADIEALDDETVHAFLNQLSREETDRYSSFQRQERQRQYLLGRIMLRSGVADMLGLPPDELSVVERHGSAPLLKIGNSMSSKGSCTPYFSISHSGKWVGCVMSMQTPIGLDIEVQKTKRNFMGIAKAMFYQEELALLLEHAEANRQAAFYGIWTKKEAMFKLMSTHKSSSDFSKLRDVDALNTSASSLHFNSMRLQDVFLALCSSTPLQEIRLVPFGDTDPEDRFLKIVKI